MSSLRPVRAFARYVRSLNPQLPRAVWLLQAGGLANMFGNGVIVPFLVIYLHNVRGISLGLAGLIAATNGAAALVSGPIAGSLADRIGARTTLVAALLIMACAFALFPLITRPWHAFLLNALAGTGSGAFWPSQGTLLSALTPADRRPAAFAQQRVTMNLGIGLGGLVGGLIASTSNPSSFTILFVLDAVTFLVFAAILTRVPSPKIEPQEHGSARGYAAVFRDRPFRSFILLNTLFIAASIAIFSELFPVFAKNEASVSEREIGLIFFLNTALIVIVQLPVAKWQQGKRRMSALAAMAVLFAVTWVLVLLGGPDARGGRGDGALCVRLRDLLARRVPAWVGAGAARLRSGAAPAPRAVHGDVELLLAGGIHHRPGSRRVRAAGAALRALADCGRRLPDRSRLGDGPRAQAAADGAPDAA